MPEVHLLWSEDDSGLMSSNYDMPWILIDDKEETHRLIQDKCVICGRKAYDRYYYRRREPKRLIVLSSSVSGLHSNHEQAYTPEDALLKLQGEKEIYVLGGAKTLKSFLSIATHLHITHVRGDYYDKTKEGHTYAPSIDYDNWVRVSRRGMMESDNADIYTKSVWKKKPSL